MGVPPRKAGGMVRLCSIGLGSVNGAYFEELGPPKFLPHRYFDRGRSSSPRTTISGQAEVES